MEKIEAAVVEAHYLVVKETFPTMANVETHDVEFVSSFLPVEVPPSQKHTTSITTFRAIGVRVVFSGSDNSYKFFKDKDEKEQFTDDEIRSKNLHPPDTPTGPFDEQTSLDGG